MYNQLPEATQAQLKEVGIDIDLSLSDYTQFTNIFNMLDGTIGCIALIRRRLYNHVSLLSYEIYTYVDNF